MRVQLPYSFEEFRVDIPHDGENEQKNIIGPVFGQFCRLSSTLMAISGMKKLYDMKLMHLQALEILRHMCERISTLEISDSESGEVIVLAMIYRIYYPGCKTCPFN